MNLPDAQLPQNIRNSFDALITKGEPAPLVVAFQKYLAGKQDASPQQIEQFCGLMERIPAGQGNKDMAQLEAKIYEALYKKYHQRLATRAAASSAPRSGFHDMREESPREALAKLINPAPQTTIKLDNKELPRECVDALSIATALFSSQHGNEVAGSFASAKRAHDKTQVNTNLDPALLQQAMREGVKEVFFQRRVEASGVLHTQMRESQFVIQMRQESRAWISKAIEKARIPQIVELFSVDKAGKHLVLDVNPSKASQKNSFVGKNYAPVQNGELRDPFELDVQVDSAAMARREQLRGNLTNGNPQQFAEGQLPDWEGKFAAKAKEVRRKLAMKPDSAGDGNILTSVGAMIGGIGQRVAAMPEKVAGVLRIAKSSAAGTQEQNR